MVDRLEKDEPSFLDTFAAALAEVGRFEEAAAYEERAIRALEKRGAPDAAIDRMRAREARYRERKPTRDPASAS